MNMNPRSGGPMYGGPQRYNGPQMMGVAHNMGVPVGHRNRNQESNDPRLKRSNSHRERSFSPSPPVI